MIPRMVKNVSYECETYVLRKILTPDRQRPELTGHVTEHGWSVYARHEDRLVRCALAERHDLPFRVRVFLAIDENAGVAPRIVANKTTRPQLAEAVGFAELERSRQKKEMRWPVLQALASKVGMRERMYRRLYALGHWYVLIALAHNCSCPKDVLESIADLPVIIEGANAAFVGFDRNKELRQIARRRLRLENNDECDTS